MTRHILAGFLIGSVHLIMVYLITPLLSLFNLGDLIPTFASTFGNYLIFVLVASLLSGLIGLIFFRYKSASQSFLTGFILGAALQGLFSGIFLFYPSYGPNLLLWLGIIQLYLPILIGIIISVFFLPKE